MECSLDNTVAPYREISVRIRMEEVDQLSFFSQNGLSTLPVNIIFFYFEDDSLQNMTKFICYFKPPTRPRIACFQNLLV
jgi:hypothetical protein